MTSPAERASFGKAARARAPATGRLTTAPRLARVSDNPCVAERPILICFDGSPGAKHAIAVAGALLTSRRAVVLDVGPLDLVAETYAAAGSGAASVGQAVYAGALAQAEAGAELAREAGVDAGSRFGIDAPTWRGIIEVANDIDAAVIVVGSEGRTGLDELIEGSVSHDVAEHARRPVLVVPPAPGSSPA